jgi:AcrR family transcriptional regulator
MSRISKPPEVRKQELIDAALSLFIERGFEAVSIRDILKVVNGHPGMFYYYFASKQEIYNEAMRQMVEKEVDKKAKLMCDKSKPILVRFKELIGLIGNGLQDYYEAFNSPDRTPYETVVLIELLTALAQPISKFILEAKDEGIIPPESGVTEDTAYPMALFIIHGYNGLVHAHQSKDSINNFKYFVPFISGFLHINRELIEQVLGQ